ncbi:LysR family transcriptional regulator [Chelativorans sp. YIM 93263]|uniref:LysR family transcriptional regulator n=1 Tax=Chelativorans sp. YIM 93263 TaxID=2906648 RepID=UPI002379ABB4|nr:LysR family transcriptional regulator [Chelativorans sp. YIM 93263]
MDIRHIDLNLLKSFDALLAEPSVSGAARRLGLSQPATSAALARLRAMFDDPILVRRGNRMVPTPRAAELRPRVRTLLDDIANTLAMDGAFDPGKSTRRFRLLANEYATLVVLAPFVERLRSLAPGISVQILPFAQDFEERLASHDCDLVISESNSLSASRNVEVLFRDEYVSVCRQKHPRLPNTVTLDAFLEEDHVIVSSQGRMTAVVDKALASIGRTRRVALSLPHFLVASATVSTTDLVATLPRRLAQCCTGSYGLRLFAPPIEVDGFEIGFAWHPRSTADAATSWLKDELRMISASLQRSCQA